MDPFDKIEEMLEDPKPEDEKRGRTQKIKIMATPPGPAPEWVRQEWIGLEMELAREPEVQCNGIEMGIFGGSPDPRNAGGYHVNSAKALELLGKKSPKAAAWWQNNAPWVTKGELVFARDVCELLQ